uniref:Uncharacterized protein n=1 Tax=Rhizophora mucronata TaxID=61149 RepID=A0A2P2MPM3_RHIMU
MMFVMVVGSYRNYIWFIGFFLDSFQMVRNFEETLLRWHSRQILQLTFNTRSYIV